MKQTIVFDLGGVLIDWNPRHVYRNVFADDAEMEYFLKNICTNEWNEMQDGGRSMAEATEVLCGHFPEYDHLIRLFYGEWPKMLKGAFMDTVEILQKLKAQGHKVYALTNWSAETFPIALNTYEFLHWFDGIVVSGIEKLKKPDHALFNLMIKRYGLIAKDTIFIDDNVRNINSANELGLDAIHFENAVGLEFLLSQRGIKI